MNEQLEKTLKGEKLSTEEARALMLAALQEPVKEAQVASLLTALTIHGVSVDELEGFVEALLELSLLVDLGTTNLIDVCGTGGDGKGTFNISTATAFVLAATGYKVAKHGNYAVSSSCGSSNVLEALGITLTNDEHRLRTVLANAGVCFLHAPLFHPAMKRVAPVRKALGFRTVFNMLGPLVNPARPSFQVNGVYNREIQRLYGYVLGRQGKRFATIHTTDGYDEVTLTAPVIVITDRGCHELAPSDFGLSATQPSDLTAGNTVEESAHILRSILNGKGTSAQHDVVSASAGLTMWMKEGSGTLAEHVQRARSIITSGEAATILERSTTQL
jgi:anthranilate phosphoribosyltransferase